MTSYLRDDGTDMVSSRPVKETIFTEPNHSFMVSLESLS